MLRQKQAHGTRTNFVFPDDDEINQTHREARVPLDSDGTPAVDVDEIQQDTSVKDEDSTILLEAYEQQYHAHHHAYGDGSHTTPTKWWAALGGFGIRFPKVSGSKEQLNMFGGAIGQTGSSTRQEFTAWISSLTQPFRILYATDSAAMLSKAQALLKAVANNELREKQGSVLAPGIRLANSGVSKEMAISGKSLGMPLPKERPKPGPQESQGPCDLD